MPPKKATTNGKRKASPELAKPSKKQATLNNGSVGKTDGATEGSEDNGYVLRKYYPPEMSNARALQYSNGQIPRPAKVLEDTIKQTQAERAKIKAKDAVIHWYKWDLRTYDNKALHLASEKAQAAKVPLICLYIVSPQDFEAHLTAPVRVDFILRTLEVLKADLAKLNIPLHIETVEKRKTLGGRILALAEEWGANHIYANMEYEVDELRREATLMRAALDKGIDFTCVHDTCVVAPGELASGTGNQYAVYTPWYRAWCAYLHKHPTTLDAYPAPAKVADSLTQNIKPLFETPIPPAPPNKSLSADEKKRFKSMWPPGEHEAKARLTKFLNERGKDYADKRNLPGTTGTSSLSVHFAAGTMATRTAVREAKAKNNGMLDGGSAGLKTWISEVAWRDFYKHVLVHWPYVCMNKPFKPAYSSIAWDYNTHHFTAWTLGQTGYPIVDAAMRQLLHTGWMHNRCRMIVASFLAKDLLLDWRLGERHFMEHLIDGDFASNNGGWGFSASTGVDPQPYFRIFNPKLQSERFDPEGDYIRKWVPELREVAGKAIHEPGKVKGYPAPIVEHKESRARALARYKEGLERGEG